MNLNVTADVIVVGAGTAGGLFAWRMAQLGHQVLVIEKKGLKELGKGIEIFHMEAIRFDEFNIPHPTPLELIHTEDLHYTYSPDLKVKLPVRGTFYVMHMPLFIQRLHTYGQEAGVTYLENADVQELLVEGDQLVGVCGQHANEYFTARAPLVVDASGLAAAIRTRLPDAFGIENHPVPPEKCLYVCLELRSEIPEGYPTGSNGYI